MTIVQITALVAPVVLVAVMYFIFQWLAHRFGKANGWFIGLVVYWVLWGTVYSFSLVGKEQIFQLARPQPFSLKAVLLALVPITFAAIGRFGFGTKYEKETKWALYGLLLTALGNGIFEEVLWRGTYMALFPDNIFLRIVYPSIWFGLWHFAPGSVSKKGKVGSLMGGAVFLGLFLGFLAYQTDSIWWGIVAHTLAGVVMVL